MAINNAPMPAVEDLLRTTPFGASGARPSMPAPGSRPSMPTPRQAPSSAPAPALDDLMRVLQGAAGPPAPPPAPAAFAPALAQPMAPATPASVALDGILGRALAKPESASKGVYLAADDLAELSVDEAALQAAVGRRGLHTARDFDGRGGILVAQKPEVITKAVEHRSRGASVPVIIAMGSDTP